MKEKFKDKFEKIHRLLIDEGIESGFDNFMGLTYLNGMVDMVTQTPELREALHSFIISILADMSEYEYEVKEPENSEVQRSYT